MLRTFGTVVVMDPHGVKTVYREIEGELAFSFDHVNGHLVIQRWRAGRNNDLVAVHAPGTWATVRLEELGPAASTASTAAVA